MARPCFQGGLTGFWLTLSRLCTYSISKEKMPSGLALAFTSILFWVKRVNVTRKKKEKKSYFLSLQRHPNTKEMSALDAIWITFLGGQGTI